MRNPRIPRPLPGFAESIKTWRHLPRFALSLWQTSPALALPVIALRLLRALQPALVLYVGKLIIDEIVLQTASPAPGPALSDWLESGRLHALGGWIALEFALTAGFNWLGRIGNLVETVLSERHSNGMTAALIAQSARLDLKDIEASEFQDRIQRARAQTFVGNGLLGQLLGQAQDIVTLLSLLAGIVVFAPVLVLLLLFALAPAAMAENRFNQERYWLDSSITEKRRQMEYLRQIGGAPQAAKEVKLFGLGPFIAQRFTVLARAIETARTALAVRRALWGGLFASISAMAYYGAYAVVAWRAVSGEIGLGDLTFLGGALLRLNGLFERTMVGVTQLSLQSMYLDDLFSFLAMPASIDRPASPKPFPVPLRRGVVFEDVGFRYPGKDAWALRHLSFRLDAGMTLALVGENGAGKTTIVKLLTRLYDPDEGRILIDGIDLREMDPIDLREHVGALFQDFMRYNLSVTENIGIGRVERIDDRDGVTDAARMSLADRLIARMPGGYDQMLGHDFARGFDLSGGEWQKIAVARAYFRNAELLILDEPTAALDARAEAELFERFRDLGQARTALLISHRFSTVRTADKIIVLEHGAILESGSHEELMALKGRYAELFTLQAAGFL